jgi:prepilin-type N-terminal cleavage/methylation domain-containing protein
MNRGASSLTLLRRDSIIQPVSDTSSHSFGFTLIELLVVISVLGIILAFFVPTIVARVTTNARRVATTQEMNVLREAIGGNPDIQAAGELIATGFRNDVGRYPRDLIELATRHPFDSIYANVQYVGKETLATWDPYIKHGWNGPYVREDGNFGYKFDAWGVPYRFTVENNETTGLVSAGPDGLFLGQPGARDSDDIKVRF